MAEFSPQVMNPEQGGLVFTHREGESSEAGSSKNQSILGGPKVTKESLQNTKTTVVGEISGDLEITEPPQIDPTSA